MTHLLQVGAGDVYALHHVVVPGVGNPLRLAAAHERAVAAGSRLTGGRSRTDHVLVTGGDVVVQGGVPGVGVLAHPAGVRSTSVGLESIVMRQRPQKFKGSTLPVGSVSCSRTKITSSSRNRCTGIFAPSQDDLL